MNTITRFGPFLMVATLGLAACGGSDSAGGGGGSDADVELANALADVWEGDSFLPAGVDANCLATEFVAGVGGAEGAESYGVTADNIGEGTFEDNPLNEEDALAAGEGMVSCDGFKTAFLGDIADLDSSDAECLAAEISDEPLAGLLASGFMGDNAGVLEERFENTFETEMFAGFETCELAG